MKHTLRLIFVLVFACMQTLYAQNKIVVFQSDFGLSDGAVSAMKGVAMEVDSSLKLFDLTHSIPAYNIWEAAYRLEQTISYWPKGTVFVSVVDPGVGTDRKSVIVKTKNGHYIVTPDNGTLTLIEKSQGINAVREIDEMKNRKPGSEKSYTFHGRDVYAYTAARLASGKISFEEAGPILSSPVILIPFQEATLTGSKIKGTIPVLDVQYGNIWTNIPAELFKKLKRSIGDSLKVTIYNEKKIIYEARMPYVETFGAVPIGTALVYLNSLLNISIALNQGDFAKTHFIGSGSKWTIEIE